jgi:hypothetical protein
MYNMIIEDEYEGSYDVDNYEKVESSLTTQTVTPEAPTGFVVMLQREAALYTRTMQDQL